MAKSILSGPRRNPVGVLLTHVPLVFFLTFMVADILKRGQFERRGHAISAAEDAFAFYFFVGMFIALVLVLAFQAIYAFLVFIDLEPMEDEE